MSEDSHPSSFDQDFSQEPESEPQQQIVVHAGPLAGKGFPVTKDKVTFGRDPDNDISWDDSMVSRHHAQLFRRGGQLILEDLGSTNGTLVNGKPIDREHILQPADIISIGSSVFGVKGFSAPKTVGVTQISKQRLGDPPAIASSAPPTPSPAPAAAPQAGKSGGSGLSMLAIGGIALLVMAILILAAVTAYFLLQDSGPTQAQIPSVVITAPVSGSQVPLNLPVTVQATASDSSGIVRMELWVNGVKTAEAMSPAPQGQPTLTASLQWVPTVPGSHTLEIKAYNVQEQVNEPTSVLVNAVEEGASAGADTPTPTATPEPPTPTVPTNPALTTLTDLNVRAGPGTNYEFVGLLLSETTAEIIGQNETRDWWQIKFNPAPNDVGWVIADPAFSEAVNVGDVPVVVTPAPPTETPTITPTPLPPTDTPTATAVPPTETPTPTVTPTPTQEGPQTNFEISPTSIQGGECVNVNWNVSGVKEVYYQGQGVPGVGGRQECPTETTTYRLRVVNLDDTEQVVDRTVEVLNPISSAGTIDVNPNQSIDFDAGIIPGDDFNWNVGDSTRVFEVLDGVQLAPMEQLGSLKDLTRDQCSNATFGNYTFIDGSDVIADPANGLTAGRTACYRTNEGRLGKLRFPQYSTQSLTVEWLTWQ